MRKKIFAIVFLLCLVAIAVAILFLYPKPKHRPVISSMEQLNDPNYSITVMTATAGVEVAKRTFPKANILHITGGVTDCAMQVINKKSDVFLYDSPSLNYVVANNPELTLFPQNAGQGHLVIGGPLKNAELMERINEFIRQYKADGTYEEMYSRWFVNKDPVMPDIPEPPNPQGVIKVGTEGEAEPFNYIGQDGKLTGFDIEMVRRMCLFLNLKCEFYTISWNALILAAQSGKVDIMVSELDDVPENRATMSMSIDYIDSNFALLVRKDRLDASVFQEKTREQYENMLKKSRVGVYRGSVEDQIMGNRYEKTPITRFNGSTELLDALKNKKIDVVYSEEGLFSSFVRNNSEKYTLAYAPNGRQEIAMMIRKGNNDLREKLNAVLRRFVQDGQVKQIRDKWFECQNDYPNIEYKQVPDSAPVLKVAIAADSKPVVFKQADKYLGSDIELVYRIASELGYKVELNNMPFDQLVEAVENAQADVAISGICVSENRKQAIDFTQPYAIEYQVCLTSKNYAARFYPDQQGLGLAEKPLLRDFDGKKIGSTTGTVLTGQIHQCLPTAIPVEYDNTFAQVIALESGKLQAIAVDEPVARHLILAHPDLDMTDQMLAYYSYGFLLNKNKTLLQNQINEFLESIRSEGVLYRLQKKWFDGETALTMPIIPSEGPNGIINVAGQPDYPPFAYLKDNNLEGYEVEILALFAQKYGYGLNFSSMSLKSGLEETKAGKFDIVLSGISLTQERKQDFLFSDSTYDGGLTLMFKKTSDVQQSEEPETLWESFYASFKRTLLTENRWKMLVKGLGMTLFITFFSAIIGTMLGFLICLIRRSHFEPMVILAKIFIRVVQGTPILVLLMVLYYVVFGQVDISGVTVAIIAFSINLAVYFAEMLRGGIEGIDPGQIEAAKAMGFSRFQRFRLITFPQVVRIVMPVYKGELVDLLKATAIVGYIAIEDLTKMSDLIRSRTYEAFFPLIITTLIYLVVAYAMIFMLTLIEKRTDPKLRSRNLKGVIEKS